MCSLHLYLSLVIGIPVTFAGQISTFTAAILQFSYRCLTSVCRRVKSLCLLLICGSNRLNRLVKIACITFSKTCASDREWGNDPKLFS